MTLEEITYSALELLRQGHIVDDERLDSRLLEDFVVTKRAEYLRSVIDRNWGVSENSKQFLSLPVESYNDGSSTVLRSTEKVPSFLNTKEGLQITDITGTDTTSYIFSYVNYNHFKLAGNGKFNGNIVFVTYKDGYLLFKSRNNAFKLINSINVSGILEDPRKAPNFDNEVDNFPVDYDGIEYIKKAIVGEDFRMFLRGIEDEVSDSSGEIIK
jgi:hypothetical protein